MEIMEYISTQSRISTTKQRKIIIDYEFEIDYNYVHNRRKHLLVF